jgi:mannose/cellobiose epimerase-like protein (N-acyl-D-glucosamine 2-epimerase family)
MAGPVHVYALRAHLIDELLPLWYERGLDRARGGFHNCLTPELAPAPDDYKRLLVQARQVYAFSRGAELGAGPWALEAAQAAFEFLGARFWDAGRGGWHRTVSLDGEPLDRRLASYDCAFVLFAMAHYFRATADGEALLTAERTLDALDSRLADPNGLGYLDSDEERALRHQNPQMHLLEAFLALHAATGETHYLERAERLVDLLSERLLDPVSGCLGENFDARWQPADERVEPGHQFEWAWLLDQFDRVAPGTAAAACAGRLFQFGTRHGVDAELGGVFDLVDRRGVVLSDSKRLWPQLEQVQALAVHFEGGRSPGAEAALERALAGCFERYRCPAHAGWLEQLARDGSVLQATMPATSVYHVVAALSEVVRVHSPEEGERS